VTDGGEEKRRKTLEIKTTRVGPQTFAEKREVRNRNRQRENVLLF